MREKYQRKKALAWVTNIITFDFELKFPFSFLVYCRPIFLTLSTFDVYLHWDVLLALDNEFFMLIAHMVIF